MKYRFIYLEIPVLFKLDSIIAFRGFVSLHFPSLTFKLSPSTADLPEKEITEIEFECLPSYSSIQYAEIADMDESIVKRRFSMRTGNDYFNNSQVSKKLNP